MGFLITFFFGVLMGLTFEATLYYNQFVDAAQKCAVNGGAASISHGNLTDATATCGNGAKFHIIQGKK